MVCLEFMSVPAKPNLISLFLVYLSIGIVSTKGEEENLIQALHSLTSHISAAEYADVVIVVAFEGDQNAAAIQQIKEGFQNEVDSGLIQVIYPTGDFLREVNREPLGWRSVKSATDIFKKNTTDYNKRMGFLFEYCHRMSKHYLHLTHQARAIKPYFSVIKQIIVNFEEKNISLYAYDIGENFLSGLGRLYSEAMLDDLSEYAALFPGGRLPSEILDAYTFLRETATVTHLGSSEEILFKMGTRLRGIKPEVEFKSTGLMFEGRHGLEKAFYENEGFAWLKMPKAGDGFIMEFKEPLQMSRVLINTGSPLYRDALTEAALMACGTNSDTNSCDQSQCTKIGQFLDPILDVKNLENVVSFPTKCVKMEILSEVKHWVIIQEISIWPKE